MTVASTCVTRETELSVIGKRIPRPDAPAKTRGTAQYVADIQRTGLLHAAVLRSPYPRARIRSLDITAALALQGVKAVVTADDTSGRIWGAFRKDHPVLASARGC